MSLSIASPACRWLVLALSVLLANCASFPGEEGPDVPAPTFSVGDRWVYKAWDGFRAPVTWDETREVIAIDSSGISVRVTQKGPTVDNTRVEVWTAPGVVRTGALFDEETRRFAAPMMRFDYPLTSGKTWNQFLNNYNEMTKKEGQINRYARVGGWNKITTPAGTFDAIAVRVLTRLDDEEFWRYATECNYLIYYSPAVRGMVREEKEAQYMEKGGPDSRIPIRSQHGVLELVSFTPGK